MSEPLDILEEMFQGGEKGKYFRGDTVMQKLDGEYITFKAVSGSRTDELSRIVSRADRPNWDSSDAVLADFFGEPHVWVRDMNNGDWLEPFNGHVSSSEDLVNVTPLMKAVVTDKMVIAAMCAYEGIDFDENSSLDGWSSEEVSDIRRAIEAAMEAGS